MKLNKASALSWLVFIYKFSNSFSSDETLKKFFTRFESIKIEISESRDLTLLPKGMNKGLVKKILAVYLDRVSSRVADTSSVVLRDISLWSLFTAYFPSVIEKNTEYSDLLDSIHHLATVSPTTITEKNFEVISSSLAWGQKL